LGANFCLIGRNRRNLFFGNGLGDSIPPGTYRKLLVFPEDQRIRITDRHRQSL
jgi:hypothetical protein